jgi:dephospho-CoA kinase
MYVIGLTGGIGSGKSTVALMLESRGAVLLSADATGHEVYEPGRPTHREIVEAFGEGVLAADGTIDRKALGPIVFSDPAQLERLNSITHPRMKELMREKLEAERARGTKVVVLEAALLFDAGWDDLTDEVWVTALPDEVAAERTAERSGISLDEALSRIRAQMSGEERVARSQVVINTDCSIDETRRQVGEEWERLQQRLSVGSGESPSGKRGV